MEYAYTVEDSPWGRLGHGPVQVSFAGEETQWPTVWRETIANLGFPVSMNPFSGDTCGAHMDPESVDPVTKLRSYAASAYLAPARGRKNLTIWTETLVEKVIFDRDDDGNPVATGVQYLQKNDNIPKIVQASREVILSAGAIHSPKILELSGVGNPAILEPLGIDVVVANAHVGENLQNHLFVTSTCEVSKETGFETLDGLLKGDEAAVAAAQEALMNGRGPLTGVNTAGSAQLPLPFSASEEGKRNLEQLFQNTRTETEVTTSGFAKAHEEFIHSVLSSQTEASALYSLFPGYMAFDSNGDLLPHPGGLGRFLTFAIYLAHPLSRGSVHITSSSISSTSSSTSSISTNESADLEIDPNYLSHPADIEVLVRHLQVLENLKKTSPLSTHIFRDGNHISAKSELDLSDLSSARAYVRKHCQSAYHFTGTCAQMSRELGGVVDAGCRVHGCVNLRVVDLSIVPIIPGCNTQATAYGVAEHAAGIIRADISGR
ncbi:GMC oxidoreductase [Nemania sp. FL0916]|nr:GMC oxidoreductase [Nemania sp. FL0916]